MQSGPALAARTCKTAIKPINPTKRLSSICSDPCRLDNRHCINREARPRACAKSLFVRLGSLKAVSHTSCPIFGYSEGRPCVYGILASGQDSQGHSRNLLAPAARRPATLFCESRHRWRGCRCCTSFIQALIVAGFHSQAEASRRGCNEHPQACTPTGDAVRALAYRRIERNAAVLPHSMQVEFWMSPTDAYPTSCSFVDFLHSGTRVAAPLTERTDKRRHTEPLFPRQFQYGRYRRSQCA